MTPCVARQPLLGPRKQRLWEFHGLGSKLTCGGPFFPLMLFIKPTHKHEIIEQKRMGPKEFLPIMRQGCWRQRRMPFVSVTSMENFATDRENGEIPTFKQGPDLNVPAADYSEGGWFFGFEENVIKLKTVTTSIRIVTIVKISQLSQFLNVTLWQKCTSQSYKCDIVTKMKQSEILRMITPWVMEWSLQYRVANFGK